MCVHHWWVETSICECADAEYPHLHGTCVKACGSSRTFKHYDVPEFGIAYVTGEYGEMLTAKRKKGQQGMRDAIGAGRRPGVRWEKGVK